MDERSPKLSETMQTCVNWMLMHGDCIHRHPGGFWWEKDPASNYPRDSERRPSRLSCPAELRSTRSGRKAGAVDFQ